MGQSKDGDLDDIVEFFKDLLGDTETLIANDQNRAGVEAVAIKILGIRRLFQSD